MEISLESSASGSWYARVYSPGSRQISSKSFSHHFSASKCSIVDRSKRYRTTRRRVADDHGIRWHVLVHHRSGGDDGPIADLPPPPGMMIELWPSHTSLPIVADMGNLASANPKLVLKKKPCIDL